MPRVLRLNRRATLDIQELADFIVEQCLAPLTAERFIDDLWNRCLQICAHPEIYPFNHYEQLRHYGSANMRKVTFRRKWIILFDYDDEFVVVQKIMPFALVAH